MSDWAEEEAREVYRGLYASASVPDDFFSDRSDVDTIAATLRKARNDALREAVGVCKERERDWAARLSIAPDNDAFRLSRYEAESCAAHIRVLITDDEDAGEER